MYDRLQEIIDNKKMEVEALKASLYPVSFKAQLQQPGLNVIAEVKRRSPSKGEFATINEPEKLALEYLKGGASAVSILTEEKFYGGRLADLTQVKQRVQTGAAVLRKDFIIDPIQLAESKLAGADAVLLLVRAMTPEHLKTMLSVCQALSLDALVEVNTKEEIKVAVDAGAEIIGVNNRNLKTFEVDTNLALKLQSDLPEHLVKVAASGIDSAQLTKQYTEAGYDAVLVGEALVKADNPTQLIKAMRGANANES